MQIGNAGITVADDRVVAATALELVERAVDIGINRAARVRAVAVEALRIVRGGTGIEEFGKISSGDKLDRPQCVGATVRVFRHRAVGELDVDSSGRMRI